MTKARKLKCLKKVETQNPKRWFYALSKRWFLTFSLPWFFLGRLSFDIRTSVIQRPHVSIPAAGQHRVVNALRPVDRADQEHGNGRDRRFPEGPRAAPAER